MLTWVMICTLFTGQTSKECIFMKYSYAMIWIGFIAVSPLLAFVCWYASGKSKPSFIMSITILAVLFDMCLHMDWDISKHVPF